MDERTQLKHPMQPIGFDGQSNENSPRGVIRFKSNAIIEYLFRTGKLDLNEIGIMVQGGMFPAEDEVQIAQLLGYSVSGFGDLSYVPRDILAEADAKAEELWTANEPAPVEPMTTEEVSATKLTNDASAEKAAEEGDAQRRSDAYWQTMTMEVSDDHDDARQAMQVIVSSVGNIQHASLHLLGCSEDAMRVERNIARLDAALRRMDATIAAQAKVIEAAITLRHCPPFRREMAASAFDATRAALGDTK